MEAASECFVPLDLLIDLRTKLTVALIHLRAIELAAPLVDLLMKSVFFPCVILHLKLIRYSMLIYWVILLYGRCIIQVSM